MKKQRAFLKWAGGKYGLVEDIKRHLPPARKLVEPFVGAGSVFLNTDYEHYLLADINPDLINLYNLLKERPEDYISEAKRWFVAENNRKEAYLSIRAEFNKTDDVMYRSLAFLYMNRFGFNGLCRYNKKGGFNVPLVLTRSRISQKLRWNSLLKKPRKPPLCVRDIQKHSAERVKAVWFIAILHTHHFRTRRTLPLMPETALRLMTKRHWLILLSELQPNAVSLY